MASSWSGWGGSSSDPFDFGFAKAPTTKVVHHDHGLIHNLLSDVRDAGVGFLPGLVKTGESLGSAATGNFHPLEQMGSAIYHNYSHMYAPALHGHIGETLHRMKEHPLQPLLDALTLPTLGGAGYARLIKLTADVGDAARAEKIASMAPGAQKVMVDAKLGPAAYRTTSGNPFIKWRQQKFNDMGNALSAKGSQMLLKKENSHMAMSMKNNFLGDLHFQKKFNQMDRSAREAATSSAIKKTMKAAHRLFNDPNLSPEDIANVLDPHIRQNAIDLSREMTADELLKKGKYLRAPDGWAFIHKKGGYIEYPHDKTPTEFHKWMRSYGARLITKRASQAMMRGDKYLLVRRHSLTDTITEAAHSYSFLHTMARSPVKIWKWSILATSPRYLVNNVIGNHLMYMMAANPVSTIRGYHDALKDIHGEKVAQKGLDEITKAQRDITGDWIDKHYLGTTQGFSHEQMADLTGRNKVTNAVKQGFFPITHKLSDTIVRRAAINYIIRRHPLYNEFYKEALKTGRSKRDSHVLAADTVSSEPAVRAYVMKNVDDILGQYHHFNAAEKGTKAIIPFYSWDRAMLRHSLVMASQRPYEAALMYQMDQQGLNEMKKYLDGPVPSFLKGAIPLKALHLDGGNGVAGLLLGGHHQGREKLLTTQGLNPYATLPDVTDAASSLLKGNPQYGEALASQVNPFITGAIQHYTGQSVVTGKRIEPKGGLVPDVLRHVAEGIPLTAMAKAGINGRPLPKVDSRTGKRHAPLLYRGDFGQQVRAFTGLPVKDVSVETAKNLYNKEQGISTAKPKLDLGGFSGGFKKSKGTSSSTRKTSRYRYKKHAASYHFKFPSIKKYV